MHANTANLILFTRFCYFDQILQVYNLVQCYVDKCILFIRLYTYNTL